MTNHYSNVAVLLREICAEEGIRLTPYADEWAWKLEKDGTRSFIFGYQFGLNPAVVQSICNDKGMTSELLTDAGIPNVPHICFMPPSKAAYAGPEGTWRAACRLLEQWKTLVVKNNEGTGGDEVWLVRDQLELEAAAAALFSKGRSMAVSPYVPIEREYRAVMLDGEVRILFSKERRGLTGDGARTLRELYRDYMADPAHPAFALAPPELNRVPAAGEFVPFEWKHNLGRGAGVRLYEPDDRPAAVTELARRAVKLLGARFVSVDVVLSEGTYRILEINSGVMMENLAGSSPRGRELAKETYRLAITRRMAEGNASFVGEDET